jgi:hypothetical protein
VTRLHKKKDKSVSDGERPLDGEDFNIDDHHAILAHEIHRVETDWKARYTRLKANRDGLHEALSASTAALQMMQTEVQNIHQDVMALELLIVNMVNSAVTLVKAYQQKSR